MVCIMVLVCVGDLYSRINAQQGVFFPEEQVSSALPLLTNSPKQLVACLVNVT